MRWTDLAQTARRLERWCLPGECLLCHQPTHPEQDQLICGICVSRWPRLPLPACQKCGQPLEHDVPCRICIDWSWSGPVRSAVWLTPEVRRAVHLLKYEGWNRVAETMALPVARLPIVRGATLLVPIPLHGARERRRGYNQSACIARAVGRLLDLPASADRMRRVRATPTQTRLTPEARRANLAGAFLAERLAGETVILIDDVFTTGATLESAAAACLAAGAKQVRALTFARAQRPLDAFLT